MSFDLLEFFQINYAMLTHDQNKGEVMAACKTCGEKAGSFKEECKNCEAKRRRESAELYEAQQREYLAKQKQEQEQAARAVEERTAAFINDAIESFKNTLSQGRVPYLYSMLGVSVPYRLLEQDGGSLPDLHDLSTLGRDGWEIVATLPQTAGIGLSNVYKQSGGQTWAGGIGGIVTGVFLVMRLPITSQTLLEHANMIRATLRKQYEDARSKPTGTEIVVPGVGSQEGASGMSPLAGIAMGAVGMTLLADSFGGFDSGEGGDDGGGFDGGDFDF